MKPFVKACALLSVLSVHAVGGDADRPNIIFVLSDDLAMGDLGCYGQKLIKTPRLDRMAAEGTRFMQAYCGTSVCAPSRASLMTGLHTGHCPIRANREIQPEGQMPLPAGTLTVAQVLRGAGYATACVGKWGMGMFDTTGSPLKNGFDHFFGYNCQRHAHSYFPAYLYRNAERFTLPGNDGKGVGKTYAQNLIADETLAWIRRHKEQPFFLFYAVTLPHGRQEIDNLGDYAKTTWTQQQKAYAAQVTRLDTDIGRILDLLGELKLDEKTLVMVAGDNGSSFPPNSEVGRLFDQTMGGQLRGFKRDLYEGALRQAALARWPGVVPAGRVCDEPWAFWDFLPTAAELAGATLPADFKPDGFSLLPMLKGGAAPRREYFYWELHEKAPLQAVRFGDWKAVKNGPGKPVELYDLKTDGGETKDLAAENPERVAKAEALMTSARTDDPNWPLGEGPESRKHPPPPVKKKNMPSRHPPGFLWESAIPDDCPFPKSPSLTGVYFTGRHSDYKCGDTFYPSWASDGNLYSPWTDGNTDGVGCGSGSGKDACTGHAVMIGDDPLALTIRNTSPPKQASALPYQGRYPAGSLVHNGLWYYGTYCLGPAGSYRHKGFTWNWPNLGPMPGFQISRDNGKTWEPSPLTAEKPLFPEPREFLGPVKMGAPHVVDFGRNMEHSPDGKAYLLGMGAEENDPQPRPCLTPGKPGEPFREDKSCADKFAHANLSWITADQIYLARVKPSPETINDLRAYEFFGGHDSAGKPIWTDKFAMIKPLIEWNNHMGCVTATYVPGLKKYLMCVTDGWPTVARMTSYILEADVLTGPWRMVSYMKDFGEQGYFLNFPSKFIRADGRTLWLCYSANFSPGWNGVKLNFNPAGGRYGLCLHEVILLRPGEALPGANTADAGNGE